MLLKGNCLELLKTLPENSVDSIVTDPPYGLEFMGRDWDAPWKQSEVVKVTDKATNGIFHDKGFKSGVRYSRGTQEMVAFQLWFTEIAEECFRVLKPGGHFLSFGGSRTYHRMAVAIEDAGFEIRDSIHWTYGSGFPKSLDVSKAIDKAAGAEREVVGSKVTGKANAPRSEGRNHIDCASGQMEVDITAPATSEAQRWQGWGTALKPSHEPIVVARKPISEKTVAQNVVKWGTGALNIDASRVGATKEVPGTTNTKGENCGFEGGWGDQNLEMSGQNPNIGRWPANTIITHSVGCELVGTTEDSLIAGERTATFGTQETQSGGNGSGNWGGRSMSVDVWNCVPDCPTQMFPDSKTGAVKPNNMKSQGYEGGWGSYREFSQEASENSASRFFTQTSYQDIDFPPIIYQAKASKSDRNAGLEGLPAKFAPTMGNGIGGKEHNPETATPKQNIHPTVKPTVLMRHLVKLVTPRGGTVLDPFLGSGTTAVAAIMEGCDWIGCELTEDYWPIIEARTTWAQAQTEQPKQEAFF